MCIEQTSDGMEEMGAALCAAKRRDVQWNSSEPPRFARAKLRFAVTQMRSAVEQMRSAAESLCSAMEKCGDARRRRSEERLWHCWGCPALRGISGQRTCEGAEKRGAKKQGHREARALIRQATEPHCCAYATALKGDALHRHRGAVTRKRNGQHG